MSLQQDYLVNKQMHVHRISELSKFTKMNEQHFKTRNGRLKRNDLYLVVLFVPYLLATRAFLAIYLQGTSKVIYFLEISHSQ